MKSEIINILSNLCNYDTACIIVDYKNILENLVQCSYCKKKTQLKNIYDAEYLCSESCGYCGTCIHGYEHICIYCIRLCHDNN